MRGWCCGTDRQVTSQLTQTTSNTNGGSYTELTFLTDSGRNWWDVGRCGMWEDVGCGKMWDVGRCGTWEDTDKPQGQMLSQ